MVDREEERKILTQSQVKGDRVLVMEEKGEKLGYVSLKISDKTLYIIDFLLQNEFDCNNLSMEESFFLDSLMRSAASYGETKGADKIETVNNKYNNFLKKKGFDTDFSHAFTPMSTIVHYT